MRPEWDVLIAYEQNGRRLEPDHGYPVRVIIPGFIGGRMIKWLEEITVTRGESQSHYHFHDNRVLPVGVTPEQVCHVQQQQQQRNDEATFMRRSLLCATP